MVAVRDWEKRCDRRATNARMLSGTGNRSIQLSFESGVSEVLRLNGESEHLGVDRNRELKILNWLAGSNLHAELRYAGETYWVFDYLAATGKINTQQLADTLRQLHERSAPGALAKTYWQPTDTIEDYSALAPEHGDVFKQNLEYLKQIDWQQSQYAICHIDLNPENIIQTKDRVRLIDWEYARFAPTIYDLAVLLETHQHLPARTLIEEYGLPVDEGLLDAARLAYKVIEVLWFCLTQPADWTLDRVDIERGKLSQRFSLT